MKRNSIVSRAFTWNSVILMCGLAMLAGCGGGGAKSIEADPTSQGLIDLITREVPGGPAALVLPESSDFASIPQDPKNPLSFQKVKLGQLLFHEPGLMRMNVRSEGYRRSSCAACHNAAAGFQACRVQGLGEGGVGFGHAGEQRTPDSRYSAAEVDCQAIRSPAALNTAYQPNMLWNGQFGATDANIGTEASWTAGTPKETNFMGYQGVETQAIAGIKVHRLMVTPEVVTELGYKALFDAAFPEIAEANRYSREYAGLAIAAYERTLMANQSPWQYWLKGNYGAMTPKQIAGARVFWGKGQCFSCHTGPALNKPEFVALGMKDLHEAPEALNATTSSVENLGRGGFTGNPSEYYQFKIPQIYNLTDSPFYGHGGSFRTIRDVLVYKNKALREDSRVAIGQLDPRFVPLGLTESELDDLTAYVQEALYDPNLGRYVPKSLPSGQYFPVDDSEQYKEP